MARRVVSSSVRDRTAPLVICSAISVERAPCNPGLHGDEKGSETLSALERRAALIGILVLLLPRLGNLLEALFGQGLTDFV